MPHCIDLSSGWRWHEWQPPPASVDLRLDSARRVFSLREALAMIARGSIGDDPSAGSESDNLGNFVGQPAVLRRFHWIADHNRETRIDLVVQDLAFDVRVFLNGDLLGDVLGKGSGERRTAQFRIDQLIKQSNELILRFSAVVPHDPRLPEEAIAQCRVYLAIGQMHE